MDALIRFAADGLLVVIIMAAGVLGVWHVWRTRAIAIKVPYAVMAGLTSLLIAKLTSLVIQPNVTRPYIEKGLQAGASYIDNPGFPSDHALLATVVVVMLYALTPYRKTAMVLGVLVIIMSIARVMALVHTPLDVTGGMILGLTGAVWYRYVAKA